MDVVQDFVVRQNIERFRSMLAREVDETRKQVLLDLLELEEAKLRAIAKAQTGQDNTLPSAAARSPHRPAQS